MNGKTLGHYRIESKVGQGGRASCTVRSTPSSVGRLRSRFSALAPSGHCPPRPEARQRHGEQKGQIKLLDFGSARLTERTDSGEPRSHSSR